MPRAGVYARLGTKSHARVRGYHTLLVLMRLRTRQLGTKNAFWSGYEVSSGSGSDQGRCVFIRAHKRLASLTQ